MRCYITRTGSYLPGPAISNDEMDLYLGSLDGEAEVKEKILTMNGIVSRHYAQDQQQQATHDVYDLGTKAVANCLTDHDGDRISAGDITMLAAGTTYAPLAAPGYTSILHSRLQQQDILQKPVEICSHAGICSSAANALVSAIRAVASDHHDKALVVGAEHASEILKSSVIQPVDDRHEFENVRNSRWFMSVFLRFMLSDGSGAFLLENRPSVSGPSFEINWTHSQSFAHEAPLCMKLENRSALLSQDVGILSRYLVSCGGQFLANALARHDETLDSHALVLPHISSFFFRRKMEKVIANHCIDPKQSVPFWSNLATAGNTGTASMFVMLDEYVRTQSLTNGEKLLLFVPESGQFNFVLISLTVRLP